MSMMPGSPQGCHPCAFSDNTPEPHHHRNLRSKTGRPVKKPLFQFDASEGPADEKKGEASQERSPLLDEPVGGRLIGFLYCRPGRKSFQFILKGMAKKRRNRRRDTHTSQAHATNGISIPILGCGGPASSPHLGARLKCILVEVESNNLPGHQMHRVKLV